MGDQNEFYFETDHDAELKEPGMYKVVLHNDDYTTMDFVVSVLTEIFHKSQSEAEEIMMNVHKKGIGIAGVYIYDIAKTKVDAVHHVAKKYNFPLLCTIEEDI